MKLKYKLQDLIDMEHFQSLQDRLNAIYSFPSSIIDNEGNILTATAWQDICTKFHRQNKECEKECIKSDKYILDHLSEANPAISYSCPHGLVDNAIPIIIDGIHYGNFFTGQFFLDEPDMEFFRKQANKYGFDEEAYLEAVRKVPVWSMEQLNSYLYFIKGLIEVISSIGLKNLREIETRKMIHESYSLQKTMIQTTMDGYWMVNLQGRLIEVNNAYCEMSGFSREEMLQMRISDLDVNESPEDVAIRNKRIMTEGRDFFESRHRRKDGSIFDVEVSATFSSEQGGRFMGFIRDITERKQAEKELQESKSHISNALRLGKLGHWEYDVASDTFTFTDEFYAIFRTTAENVGGYIMSSDRYAELFVHPEDKWMVAEEVRKAIETVDPNYSSQIEHRIIYADGTDGYVVVRFQIIKDSKNRTVKTIGVNQDITDRKQSEEAIRENDERFRAIFDYSAIGISLVGLKGNWLKVNRSVNNILGYSEQELNKLSFQDLTYPDDLETDLKYVQQMLDGEIKSYQMEKRYIHKDGHIVPALLSVSLVKDSNGVPLYFVSQIIDITDSKRSEKELKDSEERLSLATQAASIGVWDWDIVNNELVWDDSMYLLYGIDKEKFAGAYEAWYSCLHPEDMNPQDQALQAALSGEKEYAFEFRIIMPDGSIRFLKADSKTFRDGEGKPLRMIGTNIDITERKLIENALKESEANLSSLIESTDDIIVSRDRNGLVRAYNKGFAKIVKKLFNQEARPGIRTMDYLPAEEKILWEDKLNKVLGGESSHQMFMWNIEGENRYFEMTLNPIRVGNEIIGTAEFTRDITERKRAEDKIRESEEKLDSIVRNISDIVYRLDQEGKITFINDAVAQYGYKPDELIGRDILDLVCPCDREKALYRLNERRTGERSTKSFELRIMRKDQACLDFEVKSEDISEMPVFLVNAAGVYKSNVTKGQLFLGTQGIARNITKRKRAEEELRGSEKKHRDLLNSIPDVVMRFDHEGRHLFVSENVSEVVEMQATQFIGKTHHELGFPEDLCMLWEEAIKGVFNSGDPFETEFTFESKNGPATHNWRVLPERNGKGEICSVLSLSRDISSLRHAEKNYETLFNKMLNGFALHEIICDRQGKPVDYRFLAINPAFERMTGLKAENILGRTVLEILPGTEQHWIETYGKVALTGEPAFFENYHDGLNKYFEVTAYQSAPNQFACLFSDVTDRRQAERLQYIASESQKALIEYADLAGAVNHILAILKKQTGFDAVGIRLIRDGDFPYFAQNGFSNDFLIAENSLAVMTPDGGVCRDENGDICLECTCGLVVSGKADLTNPFFTPGGSFWTNDSMPLLDLTAEQEPRLNPRNLCIHKGYMSVALIPIHAGNKIVGLLQLNDQRRNCFTLEMIQFFEGISATIGSAFLREQALEALKLERNKVQQYLDIVGVMLVVLDAEGNVSLMNKKGCDILGLEEKDVLNKNWFDNFLPKDISGEAKQVFRTLIAGDIEALQYYENPVLTKSGKERIIAWHNSVVYDESCNIMGTISSGEDVTERKRMEGALRESEERQRQIIEDSEAGYFFIDLDGRFQKVNKAWLHLHKYDSDDEIIGQNYSITQVESDISAAHQYVNRVLAGGEISSAEFSRLCKDGSIGYHSFSAMPVKKDAMIIGLEGFIIDSTERKSLQNQLLQAQKMESVGRLAGGVAHDFNNMLGVILGRVDLAMMQLDPNQPLHDDLKEIRKAAKRSADLTRQLLAFARRQTIIPIALDLNETVSGMLKMLERLIGEDIELKWQPDKNLWPIKVDPAQVDQILVNLCVNAKDAISGVGKIDIETRNCSLDDEYCSKHKGLEPGHYVQLVARDNGCGMDSETLANIFDPFFTTKEIGRGTGLGLATVYGIVKQNGGFINVNSEPGSGTTFTIYLPRYSGKVEQVRKEDSAKELLRGQETILLVEDESSILRLTNQILEKHGYTVLTAGTPGEAIQLVEEQKGQIHLLLTDVVMPEMNGNDLANKLLAIHANLKTLFMSGYTSSIIAQHGVLDKGVNFIQKPFLMEDLLFKVREVLDEE